MFQLRIRRLGAMIAIATALMAFSASAVFAANGNNGTVKIQDGSANADPITRNEPHVCTFHMLFLFADAVQTGDWSISQQSPTGKAGPVLTGSYATDANGTLATVEYGLPAGHYTLDWQGRDDQNVKHKTFWVTCDNPVGPIDGGGGGIG